MHKKFEINWTKVKGGCQSGRKVLTHNSKSDLPLASGYRDPALSRSDCYSESGSRARKFAMVPKIREKLGLVSVHTYTNLPDVFLK